MFSNQNLPHLQVRHHHRDVGRFLTMRYRKVLVIAGFLITWTCVTYYFFLLNNPVTLLRPQLSWNEKLERLESGIRLEHAKHGKLMKTMIDALKLKYFSHSDAKLITPSTSAKSSSRAIGIVALPPESNPPQSNAGDGGEFDGALPFVTRLPNGQPVIPILVFACNRISISKCLDNLVQYRPNAEQFPIIVSQDCGDEATRNVILSYKEKVSLIEQPDQSDIFVPPREKKFKGYYKIARHYGWALNTTFQRGYEFVVIVEDDLNVAPDFYEYFLGTHMLLKNDSSLWCVSAWNDNGKESFIDSSQPELLYRTDFFPGLGWMLTKELWQELSVKWPKSFWDDWIRHPEQRKNRVCIRPEISRTRTFGKIGVSNGLFFDKHLKYIKLSDNFVPFTKLNLSYLLKSNYDRTFLNKIYTYPIVTYDELRRKLITTDGPVRIQYTTKEQYKRTTKILGLMDDFKSGVPRTAYNGIVSFFYSKRRVYLAPNANWKGYDLSWS